MDRGRSGPEESTRKLTYLDFLGFPNDGLRHEIIDGVHVVSPSPATKHQRASIALSSALYQYFRAHPIGEVFPAPFDVLLSEYDIVEPDIVVVLDGQRHIVTDKNVQGTPAIVVEIVSPSTRRRDQGLKRRAYERTGVREYWLVDPDHASVTVWSRKCDATFQAATSKEAASTATLCRAAELTRADNDQLTSPLLPRFSVALAEIFK